MKDKNFHRLAQILCKHFQKEIIQIKIGEPFKGDPLYLKYNLEKKEFAIEFTEGKKISEALFKKIYPHALAVLLSVYRSLEKQYVKKFNLHSQSRLDGQKS